MSPTSSQAAPDQSDRTLSAASGPVAANPAKAAAPAPEVTGRRLELERATAGRDDASVLTATLYPDLIAGWHLDRAWFRFGRATTARRSYFADYAEALGALEAWRREKMAEGYRIRVDRHRTLVRLACDALPFAATVGHDIRHLMDLCNETIRSLHCHRSADTAAWADDLWLLRMLLRWYDQPPDAVDAPGPLALGCDPDDAERVLMRQIAALLMRLSEQLLSPTVFRSLMQDVAIRLRREADPAVKGFIPPRLHAYLNHSILGFLGEDRAFAGMALRMARDRIEYVGDLVSMPPSQVLAYLNGNRDHLRRLRQELATYGLSLNSHTPGWTRPRAVVKAVNR